MATFRNFFTLFAAGTVFLSGLTTPAHANQADCESLSNYLLTSATTQLQSIDNISAEWSNLDSLLLYAKQNNITSWDQMLSVFKGKNEAANQAFTESQSNFLSGKLASVCKGTQVGDQVMAKVDAYLGKGAMLNQALTRMNKAISDGYSKFSSTPLISNQNSRQDSKENSKENSKQNSISPENSVEPTMDGEEEAPSAAIKAKKSTSGLYTISVSSNIEDDDLIIKAVKKGAKTIVYKIRTKDNGSYSFKTSRNLKGFKLTLYYQEETFDTLQL